MNNYGCPSCGCHMHYGQNFQEWRFCKLHLATGKLLEALIRLVEECGTCEGFDPNLGGPEHEAIEIARIVIREATK